MNAERLHIVARTLQQEMQTRDVARMLQRLVGSLQTITEQNNSTSQSAVVASRDAFYAAVTDVPSDSFTPAWRQILIEMGGEELFGRKLKEHVQRILVENQMTPGVAHERLKEILEKLGAFKSALDQLIDAFGEFHIGSERLLPGEAEIAVLIPREAVHDKLGELIGELSNFEFFFKTLSEVATGHPDILQVRTVSSSKFMVFLLANAKFAEIVAKCVNFIVEQYKRVLEIRELQAKIERLKVPGPVAEGMKAFANEEMAKQIDSFTIEIINEYKSDDGHRKNELKNAVRFSLNGIANRIDKGFNIEVRFEPPKAEDVDADVAKAFETVKAAQVNMQYMNLEGAPILALPEKAGQDEDDKHKKKSDAKPEPHRKIRLE
jgi:hypothetical protein